MATAKSLGMFLGLTFLLMGCASGKVLKKRTGDLPSQYMHCPKEVQEPFYLCEEAADTFEVTDPQ